MLGHIFVRYISDTFAAPHAELRARLADPNDKYFYGDATPEDTDAELEDRDSPPSEYLSSSKIQNGGASERTSSLDADKNSKAER